MGFQIFKANVLFISNVGNILSMWILVRRVWVWYVHTPQVCHSAMLFVAIAFEVSSVRSGARLMTFSSQYLQSTGKQQ